MYLTVLVSITQEIYIIKSVKTVIKYWLQSDGEILNLDELRT